MHSLEFAVFLGLAMLTGGVLAHRLRVAAPVVHLTTGVLLGFVPSLREAELPPDVLLLIFLPLLLYWESVTTSLRAIRRDLRGIVLTGTVLVAITAWALAALAHAYGLPWGAASVLGAAVTPTDAKIRTIPGPRSAHVPPHGTCALVRSKQTVYRQQTKNLLVSYSPKKLGFFQTHTKRRLTWGFTRQAPFTQFALDDLLRLAGSIKFGHATASLIVGKLSVSSRQSTLAAALKEYGALRHTVYAARYLADKAYRRKIDRQLNKGESLHSLRRSLLYAHEGAIRHRHLAAQTEQAWCLTLLTNSVVTRTSEYYGLAIAQMRAEGRSVDDELLAHISPAHSENVNFFGTIAVEVDTEPAKLDPAGHRPLRFRRPDRPEGPVPS